VNLPFLELEPFARDDLHSRRAGGTIAPVASFRALSYLGWRALFAHPVKRLRHHGTGLERFRANYEPEGLLPTAPRDREIGEAAAACISCGLCELGCDLAGAAPSVRALGLHATFRLYSKSTSELSWAADALRACSTCSGCEPLCPTGVPIQRIVQHLLARAVSGTEVGEVRERAAQAAMGSTGFSRHPAIW
jgi:Fe-S oxidoreductase